MTYDMNTCRKLEIAVGRITEIVADSSPNQLRNKIEKLAENIDERKEKIIKISNRIKNLAGAQFRSIIVEDEKPATVLLPSDLAKQVSEEASQHAWLEDTPPYKIERRPVGNKEAVHITIDPLTEKEMRYLKAPRKRLHPYLSDLSYVLPRSGKLVNATQEMKTLAALKFFPCACSPKGHVF